MPAVTLQWDDPEDAADFLDLRRQLREDGWLPDPSSERLRELVASSEVKDSSEEGTDAR